MSSDAFVSVVMFLDPHQAPGSIVIDVLQLLDGHARNSEEDSITDDKDIKQLFCIWWLKWG